MSNDKPQFNPDSINDIKKANLSDMIDEEKTQESKKENQKGSLVQQLISEQNRVKQPSIVKPPNRPNKHLAIFGLVGAVLIVIATFFIYPLIFFKKENGKEPNDIKESLLQLNKISPKPSLKTINNNDARYAEDTSDQIYLLYFQLEDDTSSTGISKGKILKQRISITDIDTGPDIDKDLPSPDVVFEFSIPQVKDPIVGTPIPKFLLSSNQQHLLVSTQNNIFLVNLENGNVKEVEKPSLSIPSDISLELSISPDGSKIAWLDIVNFVPEIQQLKILKENDFVPVNEADYILSQGQAKFIDWKKDGPYLIQLHYRNPEKRDFSHDALKIWRFSFNPNFEAKLIFEIPLDPNNPPFNIYNISLSYDGSRLAYVSNDSNIEITGLDKKKYLVKKCDLMCDNPQFAQGSNSIIGYCNVSSQKDKTGIILFDLKSNEELYRQKNNPLCQSTGFRDLYFADYKQRVVFYNKGREIRAFLLDDNREISLGLFVQEVIGFIKSNHLKSRDNKNE